jgi:hypothetical protein
MTSTTSGLWSLPDALSSQFVDSHDGTQITIVYSAVDAAEIERTLQEYGLSYQTKIIRSRKRGVYYQIRLLEDADA